MSWHDPKLFVGANYCCGGQVLPVLVTLAIGTSPVNFQSMSPSQFRPCPDTPNCVSSDARDAVHQVAAFDLAADADVVWAGVRAAVRAMSRVRIVAVTNERLHAECHSAVFGFVDDLELELRIKDRQVAVRSAARTGRWDLGVNRRRVERLRTALRVERLIH